MGGARSACPHFCVPGKGDCRCFFAPGATRWPPGPTLFLERRGGKSGRKWGRIGLAKIVDIIQNLRYHKTSILRSISRAARLVCSAFGRAQFPPEQLNHELGKLVERRGRKAIGAVPKEECQPAVRIFCGWKHTRPLFCCHFLGRRVARGADKHTEVFYFGR